jgi:hypothetical protein
MARATRLFRLRGKMMQAPSGCATMMNTADNPSVKYGSLPVHGSHLPSVLEGRWGEMPKTQA